LKVKTGVMKRFVYVFVLLTGFMIADFSAVMAQENRNPNSRYDIHPDYMMYKRKVWRRMDLREKQNKPFFAAGNEITRILINAVKDGRLYPYKNDSLKERMSKEEFLENLLTPDSEMGAAGEADDMGFGDDAGGTDAWGNPTGGDTGGTDAWGNPTGGDDGGGDAWGDTGASSAPTINYFFPNEITLMNIVEDVYFDKIRARQYYEIQALELIIPPDKLPTGLERKVATFDFQDVKQLFESMPDEAIWFNPQNSAHHRSLADAFTLRLFNARVIKVQNPDDLQIVDIYGGDPKQGLYASQQIEHQLMEYEHDLWEY
jgi:hypothetical protein